MHALSHLHSPHLAKGAQPLQQPSLKQEVYGATQECRVRSRIQPQNQSSPAACNSRACEPTWLKQRLSYLSLSAVKLSVKGKKTPTAETKPTPNLWGKMGQGMITRKGKCLVPITAISSAFTSTNSLKEGFWNRS